MAEQEGTTLKATVSRVVDGDTLVVDIDGSEEKLRLASLDTEESNRGSDKPVTPWQEGQGAGHRLLPGRDRDHLGVRGD